MAEPRAKGIGADLRASAPSAQLQDDAVGMHYASRKMATDYAKLYQRSDSVARFLKSRLYIVSRALADIPGGDLLDVGCGPGVFVRELLNSRPGEFNITAVDRSPAMVEACNARIAGDGNAKCFVARIEALPFETDSFDVVLAMGVLEYTDAAAALAELARVARPQGHIIVTMHNPRSPYRFVERYVYGSAKGGARIAKSLAKSRSFRGVRRARVQIHAVSERGLRRMMDNVGVRPVRTVYYDVTFTVPPFDRYIRRWAKGWQRNLERTVGRSWWKGLGTAYMIVARKL